MIGTMTTAIQSQALIAAKQYTKELHPDFEDKKGEKLARLYYEAMDREGKCFDLDDVYPIIGYSRKDNAKKKLLTEKLKLREGRDYTIGLRQPKGNPNAGRKREVIMLTTRAFCQFALSAETDNAIALRDFLLYLMTHFKRLLTALKEGKVTITSTEVQRANNRVEACDMHKTLAEVVKSLPWTQPQTYAILNHKMNVAAQMSKRDLLTSLERDGKYPTKKVRKANKKRNINKGDTVKKSANEITQRDYMGKQQLLNVSCMSPQLAKYLQERYNAGEIKSHEDILKCCDFVNSNLFAPWGLEQSRKEGISYKMDLPTARKRKIETKMLKDAKKSKTKKEPVLEVDQLMEIFVW